MSSSISQAFKSLNLGNADSLSDHENVFEVSYQYLSNVRNFQDANSFHNCLIALINLDKYYKAFQLLSKVGEDVHSNFVIEKAYIFYKLGKSDHLNELYSKHVQDDSITTRALKHIVAQNHYKEGENKEALNLYQELITSNNDIDSLLDLVCNERAVVSQSNFMGQQHKLQKAGEEEEETKEEEVAESYDLLFNQALIVLSQNKFDTALKTLSRAEKECVEQNLDSEDDFLIEVTPIRLTIAYIHQVLGNDSAAKEVLDSLKVESINDTMIKLIITNNSYSLASERVEDSLLLERELAYQENLHKLQSKLTKPQFQSIVKNHLLLSYNSSTLSKTSSYFKSGFLNKWVNLFEGDYTPYVYKVLTKLGITVEELEQEDGESDQPNKGKLIYNFVNNDTKVGSPEFVSGLLLLVHLNHISNKYHRSLDILETTTKSPEAASVLPCLSGILIKLYEHLNLAGKLQSFLFYLSDKLISDSVSGDINYYNFAKIIAFKLISIDEARAKQIFNKLLSTNPKDKLIQAVLNEGEDIIDLDSIEDLTSTSRPIDDLLKVEIEELILANKRVSTKAGSSSKKSKRAALKANDKVKKVKKAKFSASKVYKEDFNSESLDKERWLPIKLRSYYKPSKKEKKKNSGHQGVIERESQSSTPTPSSNNSSSSKKKKKGKK